MAASCLSNQSPWQPVTMATTDHAEPHLYVGILAVVVASRDGSNRDEPLDVPWVCGEVGEGEGSAH